MVLYAVIGESSSAVGEGSVDYVYNFIQSMYPQSKQYMQRGQLYLAYTCGVIRGALTNFGIPATVTSEVRTLYLEFRSIISKM